MPENTEQQLAHCEHGWLLCIECHPDELPRYLLHARCPICGAANRQRVLNGGIEEVRYACGRIDGIDIGLGMGEIKAACPSRRQHGCDTRRDGGNDE